MAQFTFKPLGLLVLPFLFGNASLQAQTVTDPVGVVKLTVAAAPAVGQSKLTAISATLRGAVEHQGVATSVGTFSPQVGDPDNPTGPPAYVAPTQPLNTGVTTWSAGQWTSAPHLCYIENAAGAEEAYLIAGMNEATGVLTLATNFDLTARYTSTPTFRICKAMTLGGVFANIDNAFTTSDRVFLWEGGGWKSYLYAGGFWRNTDAPTVNANGAVIFPDEGIFVQRAATTPIVVTINGSVPTTPQITTIGGPSFKFASSRYPVDTTINNLGFNDANWTTSDRLYIWNGNGWTSYLYAGSIWRDTDAPTIDAGATVVPADSAIFVSRAASITDSDGAVVHPKPYN